MSTVKLGKTGIVVNKNGFGALPIQRVDKSEAVRILNRAYDGGITYFDTARAYSDSEEKIGAALSDKRHNIILATKTTAKDAKTFWKDLETSLKTLKTDYIDIYQLHMAPVCYKPGDPSGLYEAMEEAKKKGMIRHISITAHLLHVAEEIAQSGLYDTLQFPFSYLATDREKALVKACQANDVGFISMKAMAGGLISNAAAAYAFQDTFKNALPIWGIQKMQELEEFISFIDNPPSMNQEFTALIEKDLAELSGDFCRGCGYCMPCPSDITIFQCARMALMLRRAPSKAWLNETWQAEMKKIENCKNCGACKKKCPYQLDTPALLRKNYEDYKKVLAGEVTV